MDLSFSRDVTLKPGETEEIVFTPRENPVLKIEHPHLWWPVNKGPQALYTLHLSFVTGDGDTTHRLIVPFGIREITSDRATPDSSRRFLVNGCTVFIRGSNWIPEATCRDSEKRTLAQMMYTTVSVYNDYRQSFPGFRIEATVWDLSGKKVLDRKARVDIPKDGVACDVLKIAFPKNISGVHFIKLFLKDPDGRTIADAFYWRSNDEYQGPGTLTGPAVSGFRDPDSLPRVDAEISESHRMEGRHLHLDVTISNPSGSVAFFNRLILKDRDGNAVAPVFWSDNFFSLLPGESRTVTAMVFPDDMTGRKAELTLEGWNVKPEKLPISLKSHPQKE